jgi:2'-5' RNA ligase
MTYSIWLVPTIKDAKYLNQVIKNLAIQYDAPKFDAHITLYSKVRSLAKAKQVLDENKFGIMRTKHTGIGQSDYLWKTIFLKIKKDKSLSNINQILAKHFKTNYSFEPHISLIYKKLNPQTKTKLIKNLKMKKSYTFDRIVIVRSSKDVKQWKKMHSIRLDSTRHA